jgi:hypothetical protein
MAERRKEPWQNEAMPAHHPVPNFLYGTAWKEDRTQAPTGLALRMGFRDARGRILPCSCRGSHGSKP